MIRWTSMLLNEDAYDYQLALAQGVIVFDPVKHPRDLQGRWREVPDTGYLRDVFDNRSKEKPSDTQDLHTVKNEDGRWVYTDERKEFHTKLIGEYLDDLPQPQAQPKALFTAGGSGSGKSTVLREHKLEPEGAVTIDPDEIKTRIPEYRRLVQEGVHYAAGVVHEESVDIARKLQWHAEQRKVNMVIDGTGANPTFLDRVRRTKDAGYEVEIVVVNTDADTAWERVEERRKQTQRGVNKGVHYVMHRRVSENFPRMLRMEAPVSVYDNTKKPKMIAHTDEDGNLVADDYEAVISFLDKRNA